MRNRRFKVIALSLGMALLVCFMSLSSAVGHALGQSYLYLKITDDAINTRVEMNLQDVNEVMGLGLPTDRKIRQADIEPYLDQIETYVSEHLDFRKGAKSYDLFFQGFDFLNTTFAQFLLLDYAFEDIQTLPTSLDITYDVILEAKPQHTNLLVIEENWKTGTFGNESGVSLVFNTPGQTKTLNLESGSLFRGFIGVVQLGIAHILEGIDHVLFLIALLLPSVVRRKESTWQPVGQFSAAFIYILKIATAFTLAHSITLCLATLQIVQVPGRLVESVIAASIGIAAVDIFYPVFKGRIWWVIFIFGLFHGFGFADVLAELGVTSQHAALSLFGFNLGVEIGQLAIIAVVFPILYLFRHQRFYPRYVLKMGAFLLGAMSLYWFIERAFDVNIRVLPLIQGIL